MQMPGRAVVVGAGIGGLAAAAGLYRTGWNVTVLERASRLGEVGAGLGLWSNALAALQWLDLAACLRAYGTSTAGGGVRTRDGRWLFHAATSPVSVVMVHRADMHQELLSGVPGGTVVTGARVDDVDPGGKSTPAQVTYEDAGGRQVCEADLVVGADGLRSQVRQALWPKTPKPAYAGCTAWRGVSDDPHEVSETSESWGRGESFGLSRLVDGRVYWYAAARVAEGTHFADDRAEVLRRFSGWHEPIGSILEAMRPQAVLRHDLYALPRPLPRFHRGRVALLGDAAHAMTPYLGQGACQALEDAVVLAAALGSTPDVCQALERYDAQRRPRTEWLSKLSDRMGRPTEMTSVLGTGLRNSFVRLLPHRLVLASMAKPTRWSPPAELGS